METAKQLVCPVCWELFFSAADFKRLCQQKTSTYRTGSFINERDVVRVGHVRKKEGVPSYDVDVATVRTGASSGCNWCCLLMSLNVLFDVNGKYSRLSVTNAPESSRLHVELRHVFNTTCVPDGNNLFELEVNWEWFEFYMFTTDEKSSPHLTVTARPVRTQVGDDATFEQVKTWLQECSSHQACSSQKLAQLPSRVIDVMPHDCSFDARLHISNATVAQYVALSYCWGAHQAGVTLKTNVEERARGLDVSRLSKTVQDAIYTTLRLGYRYLWVDAICIIQDSDEDKTRELRSMSDVYQNSSLTIVAANASSSDQGFLNPLEQPQAIQIPFWTADGMLTSVFMSRRTRATTGEEHEVVNQRAWTLQERLLSRRRLTYNSDGLQYACMHRTATNGNSILVLTESSFFTKYRLPSHLTQPPNKHPEPKSATEILQAWTSIINFYSIRNLSKQEDRLTAIAAMAALFSSQVSGAYLAGLWAGPHLHSSLLWYQLPNEIDCSWSQSTYVAPSWSWASRRKAVEYDCHTWTYNLSPFHFKINDTHVELQYPTLPFGPVKRASLSISGLVRKAVHIAPNTLRWEPDENGSTDTTTTSDLTSEGWVWPDDDTLPKGHRTQVYGLAVRSPSIWAAKGDREDEENDFLDGMIIGETEVKGEFKRLGLLMDAKVDEFVNCEECDIVLV